MIDRNIAPEDLVLEVPDSIGYLNRKGITCVVCGEPMVGTLESVSKEKGYSIQDIENIVTELIELKRAGINTDITVEELVHQVPESIEYLNRKGITCLTCGEPITNTLETLLKGLGYSDRDIESIVTELKGLA
ncbi:MAG: hypothetical protein Q8L88_08125 [Bacteroidota bacterium]|nr:hypothetical protein [Bacteroidota bacterium]